MSKTLAELVRAEMERLDWSLGEVATRGGTSKANIQNAMAGRTKAPRPPLIKAIARAFASAPGAIYTEEEWGKRLTAAAGYPSLERVISESSDPVRMRELLDRLPRTPEFDELLESLIDRADTAEVVAKLLAYLQAQKSAGTASTPGRRRATQGHHH